jgi:radical SAM superfamily enzyme YgiQ (UPF0313 family)
MQEGKVFNVMNKAALDSALKILIILARDTSYYYNGMFRSSVTYAPLTLTTLAALVPEELHAAIDIVDEGAQPANYDAKSWDIVGITCCASSSARAYELCDYFKKRGAFTVLGGAHPTLMPQEAALNADVVIIGAADSSWPQFLRDYAAGAPEKMYRQGPNARIHHPVARRDLLRKKAYLPMPTVIATLGCSNRCDFCAINHLWGDQHRRDISEVVEEIRMLGSKMVLFLDPNLTYNRDYAKELFSRLIALNIHWGGLAGTDFTSDRELFELAVKSGCKGILMGFESFSPESLAIERKDTNDIGAYRDLVRTLHSRSIGILGTFMLGLDGDTPESLGQMVSRIDDLELDLVRFAAITPFPGTRLFDRFEAEGRILTHDWRYYDQEHVVFQPRHMTPAELQSLLHDVWLSSYSMQRIFKRFCNAREGRFLLLGANLGARHYARRLHETDARLPRFLGENA